MIVYEFAYTDCIYESAMRCVSLHLTKKGAEKAMAHHKNEAKKEFAERERYMKLKHQDWSRKFGEHEAW